MDYCYSRNLEFRLYLCDTLLEAKLDPRNTNSLISALLKNSGHSQKCLFLIIQQDKLILGSLPSITQKMGKILQDSGCCLSEVSLINTLRENRKAFIVSLFGEYILITKADFLNFLNFKISQDLRKRKVIKRRIDFDSFTSLLINKDEYKRKSEDNLCSVGESYTEMYQSKNIADAGKNKNIATIRMQKTKRTSTLSAVTARKHHAATMVDLEVIVLPNDSPKYNHSMYCDSSETGNCPNSEKLPVQVTETDAGQPSFEPSFGSGSSRRFGSLYSEQLTTHIYSATDISYERRDVITSGTGIRNSVKPHRYPDYAEQQQRVASFHTTKWAAVTKPDIFLLADCGFFFTGNQDLVRCHQCGIGLKDWEKEDDVLNEHVKYSSTCNFLVQKFGQTQINRIKIALSNSDSSIEKDATSSNAVQLPYKIRSPRYQTMEARMTTFKNFPQHIQIPHQELAVSGLFYTGNGDLCRCFTCDGGLKDWTTGDNPVKEHATYFPNCEYIMKLKGLEYVRAQQQSRSSNEIMGASGGSSTISQPTNIPVDKLTIADNGYSSFHVSQVVQKCGYAELDVITAKAELERKGNKFPSAEEIVNTILDMQEKTENYVAIAEPEGNDVQTLVEENERLSHQIYCMLCITSEADILFLPCTHHRICHECAETVNVCPVCNNAIKEKVKTFRS